MKDLNLIPASYVFEKKNRYKKASLSILVIFAGVVVVSAYAFPTIYEYGLKNEKDMLLQQVAGTSAYVAQVNEFNTLKQAVEAREKEGTALAQRQINVLKIINAIEYASPERLFIQKLDASGESEADVKVSLSCVAENEEAIASFVRNLKDDAYFKTIGLAAIAKGKENNGETFDIVLTGVNKDELTKYYGWDNTIRIGYIPNWIITEEKDNRISITASASLTAAKPASLELVLESTQLQAKAFAEARQSKLKSSLENYSLVYSNMTRNSRLDAVKTVYRAEEENIRYTYSELCTVKGGKGYIVTYKSDSASFSNTEQIIDRILKSFNIN
ncbi:fimbrial assembly protein PilN [Ruminiclostridium sufflavum DSM 19573]|uniref:Fimbrial assembly protein PilN n=1 Tax=Ruminiclostridium sufflavum DSM 19573 TaxID=1121337 RepID=A0A318XTG3_9FIRM|nr:PilN domain-containing protein [Ruminiclostridium sufflavum]PYG85642.1 fimbrial assembly protein PilN [Ruminiclostridium sufflavum DSM 19573]